MAIRSGSIVSKPSGPGGKARPPDMSAAFAAEAFASSRAASFGVALMRLLDFGIFPTRLSMALATSRELASSLVGNFFMVIASPIASIPNYGGNWLALCRDGCSGAEIPFKNHFNVCVSTVSPSRVAVFSIAVYVVLSAKFA